jgi:hypothetical protein
MRRKRWHAVTNFKQERCELVYGEYVRMVSSLAKEKLVLSTVDMRWGWAGTMFDS